MQKSTFWTIFLYLNSWFVLNFRNPQVIFYVYYWIWAIIHVVAFILFFLWVISSFLQRLYKQLLHKNFTMNCWTELPCLLLWQHIWSDVRVHQWTIYVVFLLWYFQTENLVSCLLPIQLGIQYFLFLFYHGVSIYHTWKFVS